MKIKTKDLVLMAMMAALTAVCAWITIPIGTVPITLSVLAVFLAGGLLGPGCAAGAMLVYLFVGAVGVPVFAGFQAGFSSFAGPTSGYLIVYPLMALVSSLLIRHLPARLPLFVRAVCGMLCGLLLCYAGGTAWLAVMNRMSFSAALAAGVIPFVGFDLLKIAAAAALTVALEKPLATLDRR